MSNAISHLDVGDDTSIREPSAAAKEYVHLLINLHRLLAEGRGETEEHDALCERMNEPWERLDMATKELLRGLSGDLYMLEGEEVLESDELGPEVLLERLRAAWNNQEHEQVLILQRRARGPRFPADRVAYARGRCWSALGFHEAALAFYDHAFKLNPKNGSYVHLALDEVIRLERVEEAIERAGSVGKDPGASSRALFAAGHAILWAAQREERFDERDVHEWIIELLTRAIALENEAEPAQRQRPVLVQGYVEVGFCHERLGDGDSALHAYTEALGVDPDSDAALTARGMLLMARAEVPRAREDFERAIELGTPLVWPYLYLAFQGLKASEYERCIELCRRGLVRTEDDRLRGALYEWMVISELMLLRSPPSIVEELFERALDMAPFNVRISRYRESYVQREPVDVAELAWELTDEAANDNARREILRRVAALAAA